MAQSLVDGPSLMVSPKVQYWAQYCFTYAAITWTKEQRPPQEAHWQHKRGSSDQYPRDLCSPSEELQHVGEMGREQPSEQSCDSVTLWISYENINIKWLSTTLSFVKHQSETQVKWSSLVILVCFFELFLLTVIPRVLHVQRNIYIYYINGLARKFHIHRLVLS